MGTSSAVSDYSSAADGTLHPTRLRDPNDDDDDDRHGIRISVDLVAAARRHHSFLNSISRSPSLLHPPSLPRSLRRYEDLWMPLVSDLSSAPSPAPPTLLPPLDVLWIWHCHRLAPRAYRDYCLARFGALVEMPAVFDEGNEEYASDRCREFWISRYPSEPFDLGEEEEDEDSNGVSSGTDRGDDLRRLVERHLELPSYLSDPFLSETVYLVSARERYRDLLGLCRKAAGTHLAPSSDIALMWMMHKSFPGAYWRDVEAMGLEDLEERIAGFGDSAEEEETRRIWEEFYDGPYERAGGVFHPGELPSREFVYWEGPECDVNRVYKALRPRFLLEVHVHLKGVSSEVKECKDDKTMFLRLRTMRCHREMKLEMPVCSLSCSSWLRAWRVCCEYGTQGVVLELRRRQGSSCLGCGKVVERLVFQWKDLLCTTSLSLAKELVRTLQAVVSITAPIQAPYLLKCVPDRVTDDSGAMISDVILRMNGYRLQRGRWLTRTVLDQSRRECFVIRIRVADGFWRRGAESPKAVKWENQIIEVRQGPWSYVVSSVGRSPEKVVGTATPKDEDRECKKMTWSLSTGHLLTVQCESHLTYRLENAENDDSMRLVRGRKLAYQIKNTSPGSRDFQEEDEEHYVTMIRAAPENPDGKATALINWRLFAVEFLPEEDAVLVLLLCMATVRSISEITRRDFSQLLLRRRVKDIRAGIRDWGSVMLHSSLPHLQPWFWNADRVLSCPEINDSRQPSSWYYASDGKEEMFRQAIFPS